MKKLTTISSTLLIIGSLSLLVSSWFRSDAIQLDLSEEEIDLYL